MVETHILERAIWKLAVPLVFDLCDLASRFVVEDVDLTVNNLLFVYSLDDVASAHIHGNRVAAGCNFVVQAFNLGEGGLEAVPLGLILRAAFSFGNRIFEYPVVLPELELLQGWSAREELLVTSTDAM